MKRIALFFIFLLTSCKSIDQEKNYLEVIQGQSAGYVLIPINDDLDVGYSITQNNARFLVYGLPYVDEGTEINVKGRAILIYYSDYGESRIEIDNESLVNPSLEDRESCLLYTSPSPRD